MVEDRGCQVQPIQHGALQADSHVRRKPEVQLRGSRLLQGVRQRQGLSSAPGTFETLAWTKMAFWTPSAPHQAPTRIAPCRGLGRGIRVVMSLLRDFVADAAFVCCRLVDSSVRPGFNIQCNHGNKARWGFCNNCKSQPCQNSDSHDADAAIGIGLDGQATSEMGAGWTKCHS